MHVYHSTHVKVKDNSQETVFSFYHVSSKTWTLVTRFGDQRFFWTQVIKWSQLPVDVDRAF